MSSAQHQEIDWQPLLRRWLTISLLLHLIAAFFSAGFFHSDEHFQILEFVNWKLGLSPATDLPVEFAEKMRPWLEPSLFYGMARSWLALGQRDPFVWALSFRLLSALIGWSSLVGLALCLPHWFSDLKRRRSALILLSLVWYMPAFHARTSSENWGGAVFVTGLALVLLARVYGRKPWAWTIASGFFFGCAFEFRYQVAVMVAGALLWLAIQAKIGWRDQLGLFLGIGTAIALATCIDAWGYGHWTFAPWNYIDYNLIRGMVASVDTDPWYDLFRRAWTEAWPLLGFLLLLSLPLAWALSPRHVLTWTHLPLFLTHAIIGHKELRFLFPMLHAAPVMAAMACESMARVPVLPLLRRPLWAWNAVALLGLSLIPAFMPIRFMDYLWHFKQSYSGEMTIRYKEKNPFVISGIALHFYRPEGVTLLPIQSYTEIHAQGWLFYDGFELTGDAAPLASSCRLQFHTWPGWIPHLAERIGTARFLRHVTNWSLYWCEPR